MKTIYKYNLSIQDSVKIDMPLGSEILTVQIQKDALYVWALVETEEKKMETRIFRIVGTGHWFNLTYYRYISTFQMNEGILVFHVFEVLKDY